MKFLLPFLWYIFIAHLTQSQGMKYLNNSAFDFCPADSNKLFFHLNNNYFFVNNEYFNNYVKGYTLLGYSFSPSLIYQFHDNVKVEAGWNFLKHHGSELFYQSEPLLSVTAKFKDIYLRMGSLDSKHAHGLIEPMYLWENQLYRNLENGLQIKMIKSRFYLDTWIDWKKFIYQNDTSQEVLNFGFSSVVKIAETSNGFKILWPIQITMAHRGGQIDTSGANLQTIANYASGFSFYVPMNEKMKFKADLFFASYQDLSPTPETVYLNGKGWYGKINFSNQSSIFELAYWNAQKFYSSLGDPMYFCTSAVKDSLSTNRRSLIAGKYFWEKTYYNENISIMLFSGIYYDFDAKVTDYSFGATIKINSSFLLKEIKPVF